MALLMICLRYAILLGQKAEPEIMMSPMHLPVYKEGGDSAVELNKSHFGSRAFSEAVKLSSSQRYGFRLTGVVGQGLSAKGSHGCMEKCKPKLVHHLAESLHERWCWTGRSEQD